MIRRPHLLLAVVVLSLAILASCSRFDTGNNRSGGPNKPIRFGYVPGPMATSIYLVEAQERKRPDRTFRFIPFKTSGDVGYALLSGDLDAGFIEPDKGFSLLRQTPKSGLTVAGIIEFPYGASLILRRDLNLRLSELVGRTIAAEDSDCVLVKQFEHDLKKFGIDPHGIKFAFMPFEEMIPALEAKRVDGAVTKSSNALIAESMGHKTLYQNWKAAPGGDECCPAFLAQIEYFLVVRPLKTETIEHLVQALAASNQEKPVDARKLASDRTGIPTMILERFPVPSFAPVSKELASHLKEFAWNPAR